MRIKIIGILICMMLSLTVIPVSGILHFEMNYYSQDEGIAKFNSFANTKSLSKVECGNNSPYGIVTHASTSLYSEDQIPLFDQEYKHLYDNGLRWDRIEFNWVQIEPVEKEYEFIVHDTVVDLALKNGINPYGLICYNNPIYSGSPFEVVAPTTPENIQEFAKYAGVLVDRYGSNITYWEIWNEPDCPYFWAPNPDAKAYVELLKETYGVIKSYDQTATVIGGAVSAPNENLCLDLLFIEEMFQNNGGDYMDILSIHPYYHQIKDERLVRETINELKEMMIRYDVDIPIWVTEIGFSSSSGRNGNTEGEQAALLVRAYATLLSAGIQKVTWYCLGSGEDESDFESNFGLLNYDGSPKKAFYSYSYLTEILPQPEFVKEIAINDDIQCLLFVGKDDKDVAIIWSIDSKWNVNISVDGTIEKVTDIYGINIPLNTIISPTPIYIIGDFDDVNLSEYIEGTVTINSPEPALYLFGNNILRTSIPVIIGGFTIKATVEDVQGVTSVEFFLNEESLGKVIEAPFCMYCDKKNGGGASIKVVAEHNTGNTAEDDLAITYYKFL